MSYLMKT